MSNYNKKLKEGIKKYDELLENGEYLTEEEKQMLNYLNFKDSKYFKKKYKEV
jgi:cell shape-determining protein MreC